MSTKSLRILVIAAGANPKSVTGPLIGFSHSAALALIHEVTLVTGYRHLKELREAGANYKSIVSIPGTWLDRFYNWMFRRFFQSSGNLYWSIITIPIGYLFEWRVWRRMKKRIISNEFDVVLRLLPIDPKAPSLLAYFMRKVKVPFVMGPVNGGLPWPKGFSQLDKHLPAAGYWAPKLRNLFRLFLPFSRSAYKNSSAIIVGSSNNYKDSSRYSEKLFYVPGENGVNSSWINELSVSRPKVRECMEVIMVNRLVPLKGVDLAIRGVARLLNNGKARLKIVGDGPERSRLEALVDELDVRNHVTFVGWVSHQEALSLMGQSDVLLFPSLREFGGGVVFEALALGAVPVVADFGGPGDIVTDEVGFRIPLTNENEMPSKIESILERLASDRDLLDAIRERGLCYVRENITWEAKARMVTDILLWVTGNGPKPSMHPPKHTMLSV